MARIEKWFPTTIYQEWDVFNNNQNYIWTEHCLDIQRRFSSGGIEWQGETYTTHNSPYDLLKDEIFQPLVDAVTHHVANYVELHNSFQKYPCEAAWMNIGTGKNFQEMHTHNESTISAVYYITAPEGSGQLVFEDPKEPDMLPIKNIPHRNEFSFVKVGYTPRQGSLIIFRSYLRHMVTTGTNETPRISVAFNF